MDVIIMSAVQSGKLQKAFTVLVGALILGFCWRLRGENGWGSSWGLLFSGVIFTMFVILAVGERKRFDFGWLGLTAVSFMLTVPSWGTLNNQITGILFSEELWGTVENPTVNYVSPLSAVFLMLCLGFGLATIWGVLLGRAYSGKPWKLQDLIIIIAVFYAVNYISKATVSHLILDLVQPQASEIYAKCLNDEGITESVYRVYMQHFDNLAWAKKIDGGRNYFSSIQAISATLSSAAVLIATRFLVKDKRSANIGFAVSGAFSFAITIADLWLYFSYGGYHMLHSSYLPGNIGAWGMWEYSTGFIAGGIITYVMLKMKQEEDVREVVFSKVPAKAKSVLTFLLSFVFALGVNLVRPVLEKLKHADKSTMIIAVVASAIVTAVVCIIIAVKYGFALEKIRLSDFVKVALPVMIFLSTAEYYFVGTPEFQNYRNFFGFPNFLVAVSAVIAILWCVIYIKKQPSE